MHCVVAVFFFCCYSALWRLNNLELVCLYMSMQSQNNMRALSNNRVLAVIVVWAIKQRIKKRTNARLI